MNINDSTHNQLTYSVSEISHALKRTVEDNFGLVRVRGEISGWKVATSGHAYLKLKDEHALLDAVAWKNTVARLKFRPEDGMEVICVGKLTTYPGRSSYQIIIESMEVAGAGALMALLEKRRQTLAAEGLFDAARKKPLPFMPRTIGVITSPTGAVIRDILHRLSNRFPCHVILWGVAVQGEGAAAQIADAIDGFNSDRFPAPDLLIVARGGGSLEDLWAFNEEIVVRAVARSVIPVISAVGHETDTTLIDHAADLRAPTPTAAAEMAVPVHNELVLAVMDLDKRLFAGINRLLQQRADQLEGLARGLPNPLRLLETATQKLDDWSERLDTALPAAIRTKEQQLAVITAKLQPQNLMNSIIRYERDMQQAGERLHYTMLHLIAERENRLQGIDKLLETVNPLAILERGFVLVRDENTHIIKRAADIPHSASLELVFFDGRVKIKEA